jgi:ABC-type siderophore export system fused ATPase/permease subunit
MSQSRELETEIRKLKLELIKQELDDKIITFRAYMEKKHQSMLQNDTRNFNNQSTNSSSTEEISSEKPFSSVLFVPIIGAYAYLVYQFCVNFCNYLAKYIICLYRGFRSVAFRCSDIYSLDIY